MFLICKVGIEKQTSHFSCEGKWNKERKYLSSVWPRIHTLIFVTLVLFEFMIGVNTLEATEIFSEFSKCVCPSTNSVTPREFKTICFGDLWGLNKHGIGFTKRSFSDWFGAKICHKHLVRSSPQFPTLENERERKKRRNEGGREERKGQDQCFSNPRSSRKQPQHIVLLFPELQHRLWIAFCWGKCSIL